MFCVLLIGATIINPASNNLLMKTAAKIMMN